MAPRYRPLLERILEKIEFAESGCWVWTGARSSGYGRVSVDGESRPAYRVLYELVVAPIPDGLCPDHLCGAKACVNPDHLDIVTPAENTRRAVAGKRASHCRRGHEFTPDNTVKVGPGRTCRICYTVSNRRAVKRYKALKKAVSS